jgi:N-succinyldiaminopimelate aminotransferase
LKRQNMRSNFLCHSQSAFERLKDLLEGTPPGMSPIRLELGEPQRPLPDFARQALEENADLLSRYPANYGTDSLLQAISDWILRRYRVEISTDRLLVLNGSREGLFSAMLALCDGGAGSRVLMPNPAYQAYRAAAHLVGAEPVPVPACHDMQGMPDYGSLPASILNSVQAAYICSPSNPQGAIASADYLGALFKLAEHYDFRIFADECYSELYAKEPPVGCLEIASKVQCDPERVVVFNSLSKRSGLPGLRSGFAAGGLESTRRMRRLRAFGGAPVPGLIQEISALAWADEGHVEDARRECVAKYDLVTSLFGDLPNSACPRAGLFLWLGVGDGEDFALRLWRDHGVSVLPGAYIAQEFGGRNPGLDYVRIALVPAHETFAVALERVRRSMTGAVAEVVSGQG